jgi:hypothetical protein
VRWWKTASIFLLGWAAGGFAYVWLSPRVILWIAERRMTRCSAPDERCAPHNQFFHVDRLVGPDDRVIVNPNNDTLYSSAWLDLEDGPRVLEVPDTAGRYYSLQFMDPWTEVFGYIGRRTTGTSAGRFLIAGPRWHGRVPDGMRLMQCPSDRVWILGRILVDGEPDLLSVRALQRQFVLRPLEE